MRDSSPSRNNPEKIPPKLHSISCLPTSHPHPQHRTGTRLKNKACRGRLPIFENNVATGKSEESRNQEGFLPNKHLRWAKRYAFHCKVCYTKSHPENRDGVPPMGPTLFCKATVVNEHKQGWTLGTNQSSWSRFQRWDIHPVLRGQKARGLTWRHSNQVLTLHIIF